MVWHVVGLDIPVSLVSQSEEDWQKQEQQNASVF